MGFSQDQIRLSRRKFLPLQLDFKLACIANVSLFQFNFGIEQHRWAEIGSALNLTADQSRLLRYTYDNQDNLASRRLYSKGHRNQYLEKGIILHSPPHDFSRFRLAYLPDELLEFLRAVAKTSVRHLNILVANKDLSGKARERAEVSLSYNFNFYFIFGRR